MFCSRHRRHARLTPDSGAGPTSHHNTYSCGGNGISKAEVERSRGPPAFHTASVSLCPAGEHPTTQCTHYSVRPTSASRRQCRPTPTMEGLQEGPARDGCRCHPLEGGSTKWGNTHTWDDRPPRIPSPAWHAQRMLPCSSSQLHRSRSPSLKLVAAAWPAHNTASIVKKGGRPRPATLPLANDMKEETLCANHHKRAHCWNQLPQRQDSATKGPRTYVKTLCAILPLHVEHHTTRLTRPSK